MIPFAKPWTDERDAEAAARAILSGWITQGPEVAAFENEFAAYVGAKYACAVSSCTTALHLALLAVGIQPGDEVITVSHSFIATANSISYCGAKPVFVDIQADTFNIDPDLIEECINGRTRAILCVHQVGMPCDLTRITAIARKHGLAIIEDAACAIGSEILWKNRWERIGKPHGDIACFSFHPRKLLSTGDGGMLTTANAEWDAKFRLLRQHSMSVPDTTRHSAKEIIFESYLTVGYNYRMTDIQAAVGREQLKRLSEMVAQRRLLARQYRELLGTVPGVLPAYEPEWARSNWQSYCVRLDDSLHQRTIMQKMLDKGIPTRRGIMCAHREPAYENQPWSCGSDRSQCGCPGVDCSKLSRSVTAQEHSILLPMFHQMTQDDQVRVIDALQTGIGDLTHRPVVDISLAKRN
jgi:dTDP-4-amino-4,6-dideoxygalactose transaminase